MQRVKEQTTIKVGSAVCVLQAVSYMQNTQNIGWSVKLLTIFALYFCQLNKDSHELQMTDFCFYCIIEIIPTFLEMGFVL